MNIEIIFQPHYKHKEAIRSLLRNALIELNTLACWQEWQAKSKLLPTRLKKIKGNQLLINGKIIWSFPEEENAFPDVQKMSERIKKGMVSPGISRWKTGLNIASKWLLGFGIALFPKCPICWAAYASVFGVVGLENIPYLPWVLPLMFVLLFLHAFLLFKGAKKRNGYGPFVLSLIGFCLLIAGKLFFDWNSLLYLGIGLIGFGAAWNALPNNIISSMTFWISDWSRFHLKKHISN